MFWFYVEFDHQSNIATNIVIICIVPKRYGVLITKCGTTFMFLSQIPTNMIGCYLSFSAIILRYRMFVQKLLWFSFWHKWRLLIVRIIIDGKLAWCKKILQRMALSNIANAYFTFFILMISWTLVPSDILSNITDSERLFLLSIMQLKLSRIKKSSAIWH